MDQERRASSGLGGNAGLSSSGAGRILAAGALAASFPAPGLAQASPSQTSNQAQLDDTTIIVTAQRRAEALEDVPMSIAVITQETLEAAGVTGLRDLAVVTPGFQLATGGAFPQPAIRGVSTIINGTYENNIAVYVDGLYQPVPYTLNIDLPNVESVQVLKGPQGTLYGRNSTGGAILLTTISPGDVWKGRAELTYARFDDKRVSGYVAGPLSEGIGVSLAGYLRRSDGYMKLASRTTPGETDGNAAPVEQESIRAKVQADLTSDLRATLAYSYTRVSDARSQFYTPYENIAPLFRQRPAGATLPTKLGVVATDIAAVIDSRQHEGGLTVDWNLGIGTLKSITGYSQVTAKGNFDFDGSYVPAVYTVSTSRARTLQQAIDLTVSPTSGLDVLLGGSYYLDRFRSLRNENLAGRDQNTLGRTPTTFVDFTILSTGLFRQKKEAWALYGDVAFHATARLTLNVGGRYSKEMQHVVGAAQSALPVLFRPLTERHAKFSKFTPRASVRYEIAPRTNIYAKYSQGFRSVAFNSILPANTNLWAPADQESIKAYEVGFKSARGSFNLDLAGFYYDYKDLQVSATKTVGGFAVVDITNAPKARIYGVDGSVQIEPVENLKVRAGATWLSARYGSGFLLGGVGVASSGSGGGVGLNGNADPLKTYLNISQTQNLSGLQMSRAPDFSANLGVEYFLPDGGSGGIRLAANVR